MKKTATLFYALFSITYFSTSMADSIQVSASVKTLSDTPEASLGRNISTILAGLEQSGELSPDAGDLQNILSSIRVSSPTPQTIALGEISPKSNTAGVNFNYKTQYLNNIQSLGRQLAAIERRSKRFSWRQYAQSIDSNNIEEGGLLDNRLNTFFSAEHLNSNQQNTAYEAGFSGNVDRLSIGADYRLRNDMFSGLIFSYFDAGLNLDDSGGTLGGNNDDLMFFTNYYLSNELSLSGVVRSGRFRYVLERRIDFSLDTNHITRIASSKPQGDLLAAQLSAAYQKAWHNGLNGNLNFSIDFVNSTTEAFTESGAEGLNLQVDQMNTQRLSLSIGGQSSYIASTSWAVLTPFVGASWIYDYKEKEQVVSAHFSNDPNKTPFSFSLKDTDNSYMHINAGTAAIFAQGWSGFLQLDGMLMQNNYNQYLVSLGFRKEL